MQKVFINHLKKRKWGRGAGRGRGWGWGGVGWISQGHIRGGGHRKTMYGNVKYWRMVLVAVGMAINDPKKRK